MINIEVIGENENTNFVMDQSYIHGLPSTFDDQLRDLLKLEPYDEIYLNNHLLYDIGIREVTITQNNGTISCQDIQ
jgi:hypothetical protein